MQNIYSYIESNGEKHVSSNGRPLQLVNRELQDNTRLARSILTDAGREDAADHFAWLFQTQIVDEWMQEKTFTSEQVSLWVDHECAIGALVHQAHAKRIIVPPLEPNTIISVTKSFHDTNAEMQKEFAKYLAEEERK